MKIFSCGIGFLVAFAGFVLLPAVAQAENNDWYIGVDAGQSNFQNLGHLNAFYYGANFGSTGTAFRLTAGYQPNEYFSLEIGYADLGQVTSSKLFVFQNNCTVNCPLIVTSSTSYVQNGKLKAGGPTFELIGQYPIANGWSVFVRAGTLHARSEVDVNYTHSPPYQNGFIPANTSNTTNNWVGTYGVGITWTFATHWAARLSFDRYTNLNNSFNYVGFYSGSYGYTYSYNVNLTALGILYRF